MRIYKLFILSLLVVNGLYATIMLPKPLYRAYLKLVQKTKRQDA